ncbi:hypothetical protein T492DRAFT_896663 [Pavlovales sp. CCMP2436]|nr:hypothetical protein T492DRAFT_896663 [Pavlovales sp. CCMP2436]
MLSATQQAEWNGLAVGGDHPHARTFHTAIPHTAIPCGDGFLIFGGRSSGGKHFNDTPVVKGAAATGAPAGSYKLLRLSGFVLLEDKTPDETEGLLEPAQTGGAAIPADMEEPAAPAPFDKASRTRHEPPELGLEAPEAGLAGTASSFVLMATDARACLVDLRAREHAVVHEQFEMLVEEKRRMALNGEGAGARSSPSAGISGRRLNNWKKKHCADGTLRPGAGMRVAARTAKRRAGLPARQEATAR